MRRGALVTLLALGACHRPAAVPGPAPDSALVAAPAPAPIVLEAPAPAERGPSIFGLRAPIVDDRGSATRLDELRGHPALVTMFYASCPAACPRLMADLAAIDAALDPATRADLRILAVSFDAPRDTPAALATLATTSGFDRDRWHLAAAAEPYAREIAHVLGIRYRRLASGELYHTSSIVLIDRQGRIVTRLDGLGHDPAELVAAIRSVETER